MAALKTIIDAVNARIASKVAGVETLVGDEQLATHGSPPRVTWVPADEAIGPPQHRGGAPGALALSRSRWDLHLWARSTSGSATVLDHIGEGETLRAAVVQSLHEELTHGGYQAAGSARWITRDAIEFGVLYVMPVELLVPILRATVTDVEIAAAEGTMQARKTNGTYETDTTIEAP